ncbi:unannotated protein [freshwater metagenome]|uniref:Unannotated protein n=1 Tax=freshwater metagenome TaxID=449393 RepID=A0A6J7QL04_9ZZZZ
MPPIAYSRLNARAAAGTDRNAATTDDTMIDMRPRGRVDTTSVNTNHPTSVVTSAMLVMFRPSAESPPSANTRPWITITVVTASKPR